MPCAVLPLLAADGLSWFERLERAIVHTITCDWHSEALGQVFLAAQSTLVPVLVVLALLGILALQDWRLALRALFTAGLGWLAAMLVADLMWATIDRPRPQEVFPVVLTAGSDQSGCASHPEVLALRSGGSTSREAASRTRLRSATRRLTSGRASRRIPTRSRSCCPTPIAAGPGRFPSSSYRTPSSCSCPRPSATRASSRRT